MPISKHYGGSGDKVMKSMKETYKDEDKEERVFYATENKMKKKKKGKDFVMMAMKKHMKEDMD